jgi:hypothetical protein
MKRAICALHKGQDISTLDSQRTHGPMLLPASLKSNAMPIPALQDNFLSHMLHLSR